MRGRQAATIVSSSASDAMSWQETYLIKSDFCFMFISNPEGGSNSVNNESSCNQLDRNRHVEKLHYLDGDDMLARPSPQLGVSQWQKQGHNQMTSSHQEVLPGPPAGFVRPCMVTEGGKASICPPVRSNFRHGAGIGSDELAHTCS